MPKWEEDFGFAAKDYLLIATEMGFSLQFGPKADNEAYVPEITNYLESRGISRVVWCFDAE